MGVRAGIVVTGTEVLTGRVTDRNGPWLAEELRQLGVDVGQVVVVGDRPEDLRAALAFLGAGNDLVITSGGLGPTADDLTAEVVAQAQGRSLQLDEALEKRITAIVEAFVARLGATWDRESSAIATRKQAQVPDGATVLEPTGTAPGLVVPVADGRTGPPVIVLPGPPFELQQMWPAAVNTPLVQAVLAGAPELRQRTLRLWAVPESELATTLRRAEGELGGLEITTCLHDGELEIVSRYAPDAEAAQARLVNAIRTDFPVQLFSDDGRTVDDLIVRALAGRSWSVAVADSATGGAISARLAATSFSSAPTSPGSALMLGGLAVNTPGPVGPEAARTLAGQARTTFGADVGLGITRIDETDDDEGRPVSTVQLSVLTPDGERARSLVANGRPGTVRRRIAPAMMHLLLQALTEPAPAQPS